MGESQYEHLDHLPPKVKQKVIDQKHLPDNAFTAVITVHDKGEHETNLATGVGSVFKWDRKRAYPEDAQEARKQFHWVIEIHNTLNDEEVLFRVLLVGVKEDPTGDNTTNLIDRISWVGLDWIRAYAEEIEDYELLGAINDNKVSASSLPHGSYCE